MVIDQTRACIEKDVAAIEETNENDTERARAINRAYAAGVHVDILSAMVMRFA